MNSNIFLDTIIQKITDAEFRVMVDNNHHNCETPFITLPINMVDSFNVDYMHCELLGVMNKLLKIYVGKYF